MIDSGIRGGLDVVRALALGAKFCFTGRCFAYGLGALGPAGAPHVVDLFFDEIKTELLHVGARSVAEAARASRCAIRARGGSGTSERAFHVVGTTGIR